jgi:putative ABC transport system ATP-binding protein
VNGREVLELLSGIAREKGRTVVVVSHDERISAFADRVLWLEDGSFKDRASP